MKIVPRGDVSASKSRVRARDGSVAFVRNRVFLILALISKKIRYLVAAKQLVGVFYGVSWDAFSLSYRVFLVLALIIKKIRNLSRRDGDLWGSLWCFSCLCGLSG